MSMNLLSGIQLECHLYGKNMLTRVYLWHTKGVSMEYKNKKLIYIIFLGKFILFTKIFQFHFNYKFIYKFFWQNISMT